MLICWRAEYHLYNTPVMYLQIPANIPLADRIYFVLKRNCRTRACKRLQTRGAWILNPESKIPLVCKRLQTLVLDFLSSTVYTYIYIWLYIYICIYMYICIYVYMYICIYVYMYICIYIYVYMYICIYVYMYICVYVYMYIFKYCDSY